MNNAETKPQNLFVITHFQNHMDRKVNLVIGTVVIFILSKYSYSILLTQISVTDIAQSFNIFTMIPFAFLFGISIFISFLNSYIDGIFIVTMGICLSVGIGTGVGVFSGYMVYNITILPLIILPLAAIVLGLVAGVSIHSLGLGDT